MNEPAGEPGLEAHTKAEKPLYVDLDGTVHQSDLLFESLAATLAQKPLRVLLVPFWLLRGRSYLKARLAESARVDIAGLPYNQGVLAYVRKHAAEGRQVVLVTAANERLARAVGEHLKVFSDVLASTEQLNLKSGSKAAAIREHARGQPFVYAGNDHADVAVWQTAAGAVLVNATASVAAKARATGAEIEAEFPREKGGLWSYLRAIRAYQWAKNLLVFVPLVTAHMWLDVGAVVNSAIAFAAFSLAASAIYLVNDLVDLPADRRHPRKRRRPLASGEVPIFHAFLLVPLLLLGGAALAVSLSTEFLALLGLYVVITSAYTFRLKEYVLIDVGTLAALYTLRVIAGATAIEVEISFWLLAFSVFLFFSLALIKRCSEIHMLSQTSQTAAHGRNYNVADAGVLQAMGVASGFAAVLVFALFINNEDIATNYEHPRWLWLMCGTLLYWITRMWVKTARGEMRDDPLIYAARDRGSLVMLGLTLAIVVAAT